MGKLPDKASKTVGTSEGSALANAALGPARQEQIERLRRMTHALYGSLLGSLPVGHAHCAEVAQIASSLASAVGLEHHHCAGTMRLPNGCTPHAWIRIGSTIIHSPKVGRVVATTDPGPFEATLDYRISFSEGQDE